MDNDANAAAWAEYRFGAGRGSSVMVCITLGTGIGGGLVINGQLFRGTYGMAGEWGHMISVPGGHWCECGNRGCWEQYASGNALVREARALARTNSPTAHRLLQMVGGDADQITGPSVTAAAIQGEPNSIELLADVGGWLGRGIADLAAALDPEVVVIGGGVSAAGDLLLVPAQQAFSRTLTGRGFREEARLVLAHFRNDAGLVGAADLARHAMVEPPDSAHFGFWPRRRKRRSSPDPGPAGRAVDHPDLTVAHAVRRAADAQSTAPSPASGGRRRGSRVTRMPKPPRKLPTASQPAQAGNRIPKVAPSTRTIAYPIAIQPSSAGHGRPAERRHGVGHVARAPAPVRAARLGAVRCRLGGAEQRMLVGPAVVPLRALRSFDGLGEQRVGPIGRQVIAGDQIGEGAVDRLAVILTGSRHVPAPCWPSRWKNALEVSKINSAS